MGTPPHGSSSATGYALGAGARLVFLKNEHSYSFFIAEAISPKKSAADKSAALFRLQRSSAPAAAGT